MADNRFREAEARFLSLKGQLALGRVSREQFDAALADLAVTDDLGRNWRLDADTGKWNVFDGSAWVEGTPPPTEAEQLPPPPPPSEAERLPPPPLPTEAERLPTPPSSQFPSMEAPPAVLPPYPPYPIAYPVAPPAPKRNWILPLIVAGSALAVVLAIVIGVFALKPNQERAMQNDDPVSQEVRSLVASINPEDQDTLGVPEQLIDLGRPAAPALAQIIDSQSLTERWAALYYFSRMAQPEDIPIVAKALNDSGFSLRTTAAATLFNLGDRRGVSTLQQAAQSDEPHIFTDPPEPLSWFARPVLAQVAPKKMSLYPGILPGPLGSGLLATPRAQNPAMNDLVNVSRPSGSGVLAAPLPVPQFDCDVRMNGCTANVNLNLQFSGPGVKPELVELWTVAAEHIWEQPASDGCCKLNLRINTLIGGDWRYDYAQIKVIELKPGQEFRASAIRGAWWRNNNVWATFSDASTEWTAAHEIGHLMGVDDEYFEHYFRPTSLSPEAVGDRAAGVPSIMAQAFNPENPVRLHAKPRQVDQVLSRYGVTCPASCAGQCQGTPTPTRSPTPSATPSPTPTATATATATPSATPDTGWIDPYVQGIANQLLGQKHDPIAVAIVTENLRSCLIDAVKRGMTRSAAITFCGKEITKLATPTATAPVPVPPRQPAKPPGGGDTPGGGGPPGGGG